MQIIQGGSGLKTVGNTSAGNAVRLIATATPCTKVIIAARNPKDSAVNSDAVIAYVGDATPTHATALTGQYISNANYEGITIWTNDASRIWFAGFVAGDAVHYYICD